MDEESEGKLQATSEEERGRFVTFWTSLPGVLTGIAAVIAAVVSLVALFGPGGDDPSAVTPTVAAAEPPVGSTVAPRPTGGDVRGSMELGTDDFADLGAGVVSEGRTTTSEFFLFSDGGYRLVAAIGQTFALADGAPDRAACAAALAKRQDRQLVLSVVHGRTVCVLTGDQRIAALTLTTLPVVGSARLAFDYVLWS